MSITIVCKISRQQDDVTEASLTDNPKTMLPSPDAPVGGGGIKTQNVQRTRNSKVNLNKNCALLWYTQHRTVLLVIFPPISSTVIRAQMSTGRDGNDCEVVM